MEHLERVETLPVTDPRLGRQLVHDRRSRAFAAPLGNATVPTSEVRLRMYGPTPTPSQAVGCCTAVAEMVMGNIGNRRSGEVLGMAEALDVYRGATRRDPWEGSWEPDDTGSSGLAAAKEAMERGYVQRFEWMFSLDAGLASIGEGLPVSMGAWWPAAAFYVDRSISAPLPVLRADGPYAGGHQWTIWGWNPRRDLVYGLCWWGPDWPVPRGHGRFAMRRTDVERLLADGGDLHRSIRS
jgi:hypothetical protein